MYNVLKNIIITSVFCTSLLLVTVATSQAENGYCTGVTILKTGGQVIGVNAKNSVLLKNNRDDCGDWPLDDENWYYFHSVNQDAMLATALTSLALGSKVTIISSGGNVYSNWGTIVMITAESPQ